MLTFLGLQKTTLIDFPGTVACTAFLGGCVFRCPYCYNPSLVLNLPSQSANGRVSEQELLRFLEERRGFHDGLCVTGGEPLLQAEELLPFLRRVKALDYQVKLDTSGVFPDRLQALIDAEVLDYIAMDIKAPLDRYESVTRVPVNPSDIAASAEMIRQSGADYEFRTTVCSGYALDDFRRIGEWLSGSRRYCLQRARFDVPVLDAEFGASHQSPSKEELQQIALCVGPYFDEVEIRA